MKKIKFKDLAIKDTFYNIGDYGKIDQYKKTSLSYGLQILTNSYKSFEDESTVYRD